MVVERLIVGAPVVFMLEIAFVGAIPIVVFSLILVLILVKKPYKKNLNNYRSMSNMFISAAV
jgi:ABC-type transport system involved in cytochrome bd biosynthesis fused ATPase/permease subunit